MYIHIDIKYKSDKTKNFRMTLSTTYYHTILLHLKMGRFFFKAKCYVNELIVIIIGDLVALIPIRDQLESYLV